MAFSDLEGSSTPSDGQVLNVAQAVTAQPCAADLGAGKDPTLFSQHCCFQIANTLDGLSVTSIIQVLQAILTTETLIPSCPTHYGRSRQASAS